MYIEFLGFTFAPLKPDSKDEGLAMRMLQFQLSDPAEMLYHNEAIIRDGEIVGYVTSGNYGHTLGAAIGMGYVPTKGEKPRSILASDYEIEIGGRRVKATPSLKPLYDPTSERVKA